MHLAGTFWTLWLSHSTFALPLAIFLLHNFMREIPAELIEAARVDGAGHVAIFFRVMLPLLTPALAAFGIFQFLWVWNDLLVALMFAGGGDAVAPITLQLANLSRHPGHGLAPAVGGRLRLDHRAGASCSSRCSATSSAACWPAASRAENPFPVRGEGRTPHRDAALAQSSIAW